MQAARPEPKCSRLCDLASEMLNKNIELVRSVELQ